MPTQIVIRPSGVWNSRAPFTNYFAANREIGIHFNALVLAGSRLRADLLSKSQNAKGGSVVGRLRRANRVAAFAWLGYQRSLGRTPDGTLAKPTANELAEDLRDSLQDLYQMMLIKVSSLYETFAQCWALNYLLTRLEQPPHDWSTGEQTLADRLSPLLSTRIPSWPAIRRAIPWIADELRQLPHIYFDKNTGQEIRVPVSKILNALSVIEFWREYRNLLIHRGGLVSTDFSSRFTALYEELRKPFGEDIPPISERMPLRFSDALPRAVATVHYRAASHLTSRLAELSGGRRGHLAAPGDEVVTVGTTLKRANPLLMAGDHAVSLQWVNQVHDEEFLRSMAQRLQTEGRARGVKPPNLQLRVAKGEPRITNAMRQFEGGLD